MRLCLSWCSVGLLLSGEEKEALMSWLTILPRDIASAKALVWRHVKRKPQFVSELCLEVV